MVADSLRLQDLNTLLRDLKNRADSEYRSLIISIDFGTTYSGIGYIFTADPEKVHVLDQWPGQTSARVTSQKVPTVLKYGSGGPGFSWGYQVGLKDEKKLEAFKLLLDPTLPKPEYTQIMKVEKNFKEFVKTPAHAVNDFIGALYRYAIAAIEEKHTQAYSEILAVKFLVSTPAGWPPTVQRAILEAAQVAGISPVTLITEAEAAAFFTAKSIEAKTVTLKAGDTIMVCDAGGATTDLTSYTIRKMNPLEVVELIPPLTRAGGSLNLDKNFENHIMRNLLEEEEFIPLKKSPLYAEALEQFNQEIKPVFTSSKTKQFSVQLKGTKLTDYADGKLRNNTMIFDTKALDAIFMPVANTVATCLTEQMNAIRVKKVDLNSHDKTSVNAVFLVGGFGANKYLLEHLGKKFPSTKFVQPTNAWTAVLRGALLRYAPSKKPFEPFGSSSSPSFSTNRATKHYGIACSPIWNENVHENVEKFWDSWEGVWRFKSVNWLLKKGDDLRKSRKFSMPFYKQCGPHPEGDDFFISVSLEQSTAIEPPQTSTHSSISTNKTIRVPIDSIPESLFHKKTRNSDGEPYWQLLYEVILEIVPVSWENIECLGHKQMATTNLASLTEQPLGAASRLEFERAVQYREDRLRKQARKIIKAKYSIRSTGMDPISGAGILMAGLTFPAQMFSSGVVAYTTISQVRHMGSSFSSWYWLFKQQESRFIFWGMSHKACSPGGLDENMMPTIVYQTIVPALAQITALLEDKDALCRRYGLQEIGQITPVEYSVIRRESMRQQNTVKRLQKSSSLFRKVQWAIKDQGRFAELVQQLSACIDTLYDMLPVPRGAFVGDTISAETLADTLISRSGLRVEGLQQTTDPRLQELRETERAWDSAMQRETHDASVVDQPVTSSPHLLNVQQVELLDASLIPNSAPHMRSWARQRQSNAFSGQVCLVIEWRRYDPQRGREATKRILHRRIEALATMLKEKPRTDSFRVFDCIGYFEDNTDTRFGLTFRLPNDYNQQRDPVPLSLFQAIANYPDDIPYLGERFRLAYLLAESVHALHAAGWLHKGISSHNILLLQKNTHSALGSVQRRSVSLDNPYFTGFVSSRPDSPDEESSKTAAAKEIGLYCHPDVQGNDGRTVAGFRAIYDIYSLGTVLIEIGTWRSLARWSPKHAPPTLNFKRHLLDKVVPYLGASMGENYMNAVSKCLEGSFERLTGFAENEYNSPDYKNNVRQGLLWEVVTVLRDCRV